jgi:hypothetical protein
MAEDHSPLLKIVGRNFDRYPIAGERLYPVLFHPAGGVGDKGMAIIELHAIAGIGQYLGNETFEFQKFFFRQVTIPLNGLPDAASAKRRRDGPDD